MDLINKIVFCGLVICGGIFYGLISLGSLNVTIEVPNSLAVTSMITAYIFGVYSLIAFFIVLVLAVIRMRLSVVKPLHAVNAFLALVGFGGPYLVSLFLN